MTRLPASLFILALYLGSAGYDSCSGNILHDDGFDLWCGAKLCSWQLEKGDVKQAPTWDAADLGVELVGDDVSIAQTSNITYADVTCVRFALVADIALDAQVTLTMDLYGDGVVDYAQELPTSDWAPLEYLVALPQGYQGIRFRLHKTGPGHAVLAQIKAVRSDQCTGAPLAEVKRPDGAGCGLWAGDWEPPSGPDDAHCLSDHCGDSALSVARDVPDLLRTCGECDTNADCPGQVCGAETRVPAFLQPYRGCGPIGRHVLGERCITDLECASAICNGGWCSGCRAADHPCDEGRLCQRRDRGFRCDPDHRRGAAGEPCLEPSDCASGTCAGSERLRECYLDNRRCAVDADCPPDPPGTDLLGVPSGAEFGTCIDYGVAGGSCT